MTVEEYKKFALALPERPKNFLVWLKGFFDGKSIKVQDQDGVIFYSNYVQMLCEQFATFVNSESATHELVLLALKEELARVTEPKEHMIAARSRKEEERYKREIETVKQRIDSCNEIYKYRLCRGASIMKDRSTIYLHGASRRIRRQVRINDSFFVCEGR